MASQVDVCNLALVNLGEAPTITAINPPDGTKYAAACAQFFPIALDHVLSECDWSFARKREVLTAVDVTAPDAWEYTFAIPTDMVMVRMVQEDGCEDPNVGIPYEIAYGRLYSNHDEVVMVYTYRNSNVQQWHVGAVQALAGYLSYLLAAPVTKNPQVTQAMRQFYGQLLGEAMTKDLPRYSPPVTYDSPSISARYS